MFQDSITPVEQIHETLEKYILTDGFDLVLDLNKSRRNKLVDQKTGNEYIDFVSSLCSIILGYNHPVVVDAVREQLDYGLFEADGGAWKNEAIMNIVIVAQWW